MLILDRAFPGGVPEPATWGNSITAEIQKASPTRRPPQRYDGGMFSRETWEVLSYAVTVVGLPLAIGVFLYEQRKERDPQHVHDADHEQKRHQHPAASDAVGAVAQT